MSAVELDRRRGGGLRVRLIWVPDKREVFVEQLDVDTDKITLRQVPEGAGLEVFNHPENYNTIKLPYRYQVAAGEIEEG